MDEIRYEKNFLKDVIVRIDFATSIDTLKNGIPKSMQNKILKNFGIPELNKVTLKEMEFKVDGKGKDTTKIKNKSINEHYFYGKNREKFLVITSEFFAITYNKYEIFEAFKEELEFVYDIIAKHEPDLKIKRIGLRYVNLIELFEENPLDWSKYINDSLLCAYSFYNDKKKVSRVFNVLDINFGEYKLTFQYGMHNPDFPSPIVKKVFVMDIDAYFEGFIEHERDVKNYVEVFHKEIQLLFERSIKDGLRVYMNAKG